MRITKLGTINTSYEVELKKYEDDDPREALVYIRETLPNELRKGMDSRYILTPAGYKEFLLALGALVNRRAA